MAEKITKGQIYDYVFESAKKDVSREIFEHFQTDFTYREKCALRLISCPTDVRISTFSTNWSELLLLIQSALTKAQANYDRVCSEIAATSEEAVHCFVLNQIVYSFTVYLMICVSSYDIATSRDFKLIMPVNALPESRDKQILPIPLPVESISEELRGQIDMILTGQLCIDLSDDGLLLLPMIKNLLENEYFQHNRLFGAYTGLQTYYLDRLAGVVQKLDVSRPGPDALIALSREYKHASSISRSGFNVDHYRSLDYFTNYRARELLTSDSVLTYIAGLLVRGVKIDEVGYILSEVLTGLDLDDPSEDYYSTQQHPITRELIHIRLPFLGLRIASTLFTSIIGLGNTEFARARRDLYAYVPHSLRYHVDCFLILLDEREIINLWDVDRDLKLVSLAMHPSNIRSFIESLDPDLSDPASVVSTFVELVERAEQIQASEYGYVRGIDVNGHLNALLREAMTRYLQEEGVMEYIGTGLGNNIAAIQEQFSMIGRYIICDFEIPSQEILVQHGKGKYKVSSLGLSLFIRAILKQRSNRAQVRKIRTAFKAVGIWDRQFDEFMKLYGVNH